MGEKRIFLQENRDRIEKKYQVRCERFPEIFEKINDKLTGCDTDTAAAMKFLYGYMPYSDIGNYDFENFLDYAAHSVALWEKYDRVRELPEDIYMNYILFHRVNEEEIAPCRSLFFEQMSDAPVWLTQKSEKETALEVNYWCTGEATYHTTDERTLPARTVYLRGNGRCGEESVFVVNAMRSIGIPARQVYTPRWSHCDDNHAWVEVYCGGKWYFLGACEAEPILNKGWFTNASSRAMMIHSRWFDKKMPGSEMIVGKAGIETVLNQLERYAKTTELTIRVTDEEEQPVIGLELHFEILNYGEYSAIASAKTDEKGMASLTTGLGSLCISAVYEGNYIDRWIDTREGSECHFVVGADKSQEKTSDIIWRELDFIAPVDTPVNADMPTREQKAESDLRLEKLTARCRNKMENWKNPQLQEFASPDKPMQELRKKMISCLSEKDMDDCRAKVLEEHLVQAASYEGKYPDEVYAEALLC
ncbi:MAG: transglutaminase domain-containing protein, partial [Clostridia bacterium]|nr:transglutaminase domain-containing protein [Clostridia bacterium]